MEDSRRNFLLTGTGAGVVGLARAIVLGAGPDEEKGATKKKNGDNTATHSIADGEYRINLNPLGLTSASYDFFRLLGYIDGNGQVTIADFSTMVGTFGRATSNPLYLGADDLDGDNVIGIARRSRSRPWACSVLAPPV